MKPTAVLSQILHRLRHHLRFVTLLATTTLAPAVNADSLAEIALADVCNVGLAHTEPVQASEYDPSLVDLVEETVAAVNQRSPALFADPDPNIVSEPGCFVTGTVDVRYDVKPAPLSATGAAYAARVAFELNALPAGTLKVEQFDGAQRTVDLEGHDVTLYSAERLVLEHTREDFQRALRTVIEELVLEFQEDWKASRV